MSFEDYQVHREGLAEVLADYADVPVPYVTDNPHTPVPYKLTPAGEAAAEPDTWTSPVAYLLTREGEVAGAGFVAREPEAGSAEEQSRDAEFDAGWNAAHRDYCPCNEPDASRCPQLEAGQ